MSPKRVNQCLVPIALLIVAVYLGYRALYTFSLDSIWFALLFYAAELHGTFVFFLFCFETWDPQHPEPIDPPPGMKVDLYVCTYNEDPDLLRKTILGTEAIGYPHTTYICDDGHREEVRQLAEELGVEYLDRPDNSHAKAGNINHALPQTRGDFIAILDADHVPLPDFLDRMLGYFTDPKVAFVQSPQTFYNLDAPEERVDIDSGKHWDEAEIFFHLILPGKNRWNSVYFCGTGGIIRRTALEQVGGFATDTITEDIHTAGAGTWHAAGAVQRTGNVSRQADVSLSCVIPIIRQRQRAYRQGVGRCLSHGCRSRRTSSSFGRSPRHTREPVLISKTPLHFLQ